MKITGFVVEKLPFVFDSLFLASQARFPTSRQIDKYEEEEEAE